MIVDVSNKLIRLKVVYYGPAMAGKTTNLEYLAKKEGMDILKIDTSGDKTLVFDFASKKVRLDSFTVSFAFYTVPGQEIYKDIRLTVLKGVDGIVMVYDAQRERLDENIRFKHLLISDIKKVGKTIESIPVVFQYNKMDLPNVLDFESLEKELNQEGYQSICASAVRGEGVLETSSLITEMLISKLSKLV